jgi:hypothetical protein
MYLVACSTVVINGKKSHLKKLSFICRVEYGLKKMKKNVIVALFKKINYYYESRATLFSWSREPHVIT